MHGRKRPPKDAPAPTAEQVAVLAKKVESYRALSGVALQHRHANARDAQAFKLNGTLVSLNPDVASLWNYRRECLMDQLEHLPEAAAGASEGGEAASASSASASAADASAAAGGGHAASTWRFSMYSGNAGAGGPGLAPPPRLRVDLDALRAAVAEELRVSQAGIMKNPKSYPAWHHRQWVIQRYGGCKPAEGSEAPVVDMAQELALCGTMLTADERNFHCWKYRKWVVWMSGHSLAEELAYTSALITKNFSNYSAWHYRADLLPLVQGGEDGTLAPEVLAKEFALVRNAYFTEPDDQSAWFYHRWLCQAAATALKARCGRGESEAIAGLLGEEAQALREVAAVESRCKWPLLALAALATHVGDAVAAAGASAAAAVAQLLPALAPPSAATTSPAPPVPEAAVFYAAAAGLRDAATGLDPTHAGCYAALDVRHGSTSLGTVS